MHRTAWLDRFGAKLIGRQKETDQDIAGLDDRVYLPDFAAIFEKESWIETGL